MRYMLFFICVWLLSGCSDSKNEKSEFMPVARGDIGEIILVMDSGQYEGELGSAVKQTFRAPMQGLPQDEPMFSLGKASPKRLNSVLRSASNMIFVMTLDSKTSESNVLRSFFTNQSLKTIQRDSSIFQAIRKDEFARGQVVLYLFAGTEERLIRRISENKDQLQGFFESVERERLKDRLFKERETQLEKALAEDHPFSLQIPFGWELARNGDNFIWLRVLEAASEKDIFIYYEPYRSADIFSNVPEFRDRITEEHLKDSEKPDLYITRQERDDIRSVTTERVNFDSMYAVKSRGLWKISDNSAGGPFVSYTMVDEDQQMLFYIEGYVYSPGTTKKNLIRELDAILSTFKTSEPST